MENSQVGALKPSQNPFEFPFHRRRPLRSKAVCMLEQIVSHCSSQSHALDAILEEPILDSSGSAFGEVTGEGIKLSENLSVGNELLVIQNEETAGFRAQGCNGNMHMEVDRLGDVRTRDNQEDQIILPEFGSLDEVLSTGPSNSGNDNAKESQPIEINDFEVQFKEKELEKLIFSSDMPLVIEDGEISDLMDLLLEEDPKLEQKSAENGQISQVITDKKVPSVDELQKRIDKDVVVAQLPQSMEHRKPINYDFVESDRIAPKRSFKDDNDKKTKRQKRDPQTEAKKGKKKQKERIKRAEKRKMEGVKRWRLDPVPPKPKQKPECRHFKMGRCDVENCKFSHDVVPTTKSKACCHHARGSCLKGDECPYDHDLSKYDCSNFITNGFCNRGASCMFKHEHKIPVKEGGPTASNMPNLEQMSVPSSSLPSFATPKKQFNGQDPSIRNPNIKPTSTNVSPCKTTLQNLQTPVAKPSLPAPKGMTFLSNSHISRSSDQTADNASEPEVPKTTPAPAPRGINFLSFGKGIGKSPLSDSVGFKTPPVPPSQGIKAPSEDSSTVNKQADSVFQQHKIIDSKQIASTSSSFSEKVQLPSTTPSSVHNALKSTFAFAARLDKSVGTSQNQSANKVSTILDFIYGDRNRNKQS